MTPRPGDCVVTIFRSRLRSDAEANGYTQLADTLEHRARSMPGFVDFKTFSADDGERVSIAVFDCEYHHNAWRDDPAHRAAQRRGRQEFYSEYSITVCHQTYQRTFTTRPQPDPVER
jgi:heme-degrading monooxygenase HmoA